MSAVIINAITTIGLEQNHHSTCSIDADYFFHAIRDFLSIIREEEYENTIEIKNSLILIYILYMQMANIRSLPERKIGWVGKTTQQARDTEKEPQNINFRVLPSSSLAIAFKLYVTETLYEVHIRK